MNLKPFWIIAGPLNFFASGGLFAMVLLSLNQPDFFWYGLFAGTFSLLAAIIAQYKAVQD